MRTASVVLLICLVHAAYCRDFYMGMFRKDDFLVAADSVYKPKNPSRITFAKYGKVFKCPITYFRIVDRLGSNSNPRVDIIRGGLHYKYVVARLSVYNKPISVNIYIGCENKNTKRKATSKATIAIKTTKIPQISKATEVNSTSKNDEETTDAAAPDSKINAETTIAGDAATKDNKNAAEAGGTGVTAGADGAKGADGADGAKGADGADGADGKEPGAEEAPPA